MIKRINFFILFFGVLINVSFTNRATNKQYSYSANQIFDEKLDQLPQVNFWRWIMNLNEDSCLLNIKQSRKVIATYHIDSWSAKSPEEKQIFANELKNILDIQDTNKVVGTSGKKFFYTFEKVAENIPKGIDIFESNGVSGFYAKAILLIESPNQLQKSVSGAYGPFQLMPYVARQYGLKVNKKRDERANFNRSAYAASQLIKKVCIPYTKSMLDELNIPYDENELWFKLLAMHIYHAGASNVKPALFSIQNRKPKMELIQQLWNTSYGNFGNASQNYSQLILAAFVEYYYRVEKK